MSILSVPNTIEAGQPVKAAPLRENFVSIQTWANGNISAANLTDLSITSAKIAPLAVTNEKLAGGITLDKLASSMAVYTLGPTSNKLLTIATAGIYVDIPDTTMDAITPVVDSILMCSGFVTVSTTDGTTPRILVQLANGTTGLQAVEQTVSVLSANARHTIPLSFAVELNALTTYTLKLRASMSVTGDLDVRVARFSGLIVPR